MQQLKAMDNLEKCPHCHIKPMLEELDASYTREAYHWCQKREFIYRGSVRGWNSTAFAISKVMCEKPRASQFSEVSPSSRR